MKRWIIRSFFIGLFLFAHIIGSYGVQFVDFIFNYDLETPFWSRLDAPIRVLPVLFKRTFERPDANWIPFWVGYLFPASVVVGGYFLWRTSRPKAKGRAFPVELTKQSEKP